MPGFAGKLAATAVVSLGLAAGFAPAAGADVIGPITFEPPSYTTGNINGQNGWSKTGPYDVEVASVSAFTAAAGYGFGTQALRASNAVTSGSFGDQTFTPGLANPAGESGAPHFDASFRIGTTQAVEQPGLATSVSPDSGDGSRMSYLRFDDQADGVHVHFVDVTDPGPLGTFASFNDSDIGTLSHASAHSVRFSIDFVPGPANDVVRIYLDGSLAATGTTWEDYYRYDPEQAGNGNQVPSVSKMLFREGGPVAVPANAGQGYLVDGLSLGSVPSKDQCKNGGWAAFSNPSFKNQGDCVSYSATGGRH